MSKESMEQTSRERRSRRTMPTGMAPWSEACGRQTARHGLRPVVQDARGSGDQAEARAQALDSGEPISCAAAHA